MKGKKPMWLPKDERRLIAGYYRIIGNVGVEKVYELGELQHLLSDWRYRVRIPEYGDAERAPNGSGGDDVETLKHGIRKYIDRSNRVRNANRLLAARNLISETPHESERDVSIISLTVEGYDLGRNYSCFWTRSGLWFREYKDHWLWLIASFLGGAVSVKLIEFLVGTAIGSKSNGP